MPSSQKSGGRPALRLSSPRNEAGEGRFSHTWGRKVPRCVPNWSHDPILARAQLRERMFLVAECERRERRQHRHLDSRGGQFVHGKRRKAGSWNAAARAFAFTSSTSVRCTCRLPMQPRSRFALFRVTNALPDGAGNGASSCHGSGNAEAAGDRGARDRKEYAAVSGFLFVVLLVSPRGGLVIKRERGISHDTALVAGGIPGVAQVQQFRAQSAAMRFQQQSIDRRGTAGLLVIDLRRHVQDQACGLRRRSSWPAHRAGNAKGRS